MKGLILKGLQHKNAYKYEGLEEKMRISILKKVFLVSVSVLFCMSLVAPGAFAKTKTFKLGGINPPKAPVTQALYKFAELVEKYSDGKMKVQVFPSSQLGSAPNQIDAMMMGGLDMHGNAVNFYAQYAKNWNVLNAAFLYDDTAHVKKYLESDIHKQLVDELVQAIGVREIVSGIIRAPEVLESTQPFIEIDDFKGAMMRVPQIELYQLFAEELGCKTVRIAWGEVYMALKQGVAESFIPPLGQVYDNQFYKVAPHVLMTRHNYARASITISEKKWQSLSAEEKEIMLKAGKGAEEFMDNLVASKVDKDIEVMKKAGAKFYEIENRQEWLAKYLDFNRQLEEKGFWEKGLYQKIRDLAQ